MAMYEGAAFRAVNGFECLCGGMTPHTFTRPTTRQTFTRCAAECERCRQPHALTYNWRLRRVVRVEPLIRNLQASGAKK